MSFGTRVKERREALGLKQSDLGQILGISGSAIGNYETGVSSPKADILYKIFDALECDANFLFQDEMREITKSNLSTKEEMLIKNYRALDNHGQRMVRIVIDEETARMASEQEPPQPKTKIIPLLGSAFAAGLGDPDFGNPWEDYEVPADSKAEFAVRISGNSMEPYLPDGSIQLAQKITPKDGEVGVFLLDGALLVKQFCMDIRGSIYLFALNRDRRDADVPVMIDDDHDIRCFGTILMSKRVPLPTDPGWV